MLQDTLRALLDQKDPGCSYEIIPVDNNSSDNTKQVILELAGKSSVPIKYTHERQAGSAFARNTGFKAASGKLIGLIDDDIIVDKYWVKNIVKAYDNPMVSCLGGKINLRWNNGLPPAWFEPYRGILGEIDLGQDIIEITPPQWINAGNFSIRKDVLFEVGGYNPCNAPKDILIGDGEVGLILKVIKKGYKVYWSPFAECEHVNDAKEITLRYLRNRQIYNGMSEAYTVYRNNVDKDLYKVIRIKIVRLFMLLLRRLRLLQINKYENIKIKNTLAIDNTKGFLLYTLKIMTHSQLRKLVIKNNWLN